jgi:glycosyltransferase involved in cell wall biosynthesis
MTLAPSVQSTRSRQAARARPGHGAWQGPSVGFVGTYPPTRCGIATFTYALRRAIALPRTGVVALVNRAGETPFPREVLCELVAGSPISRVHAAASLNLFEAVVLQHEFGIYGGADGSEVLDLVAQLDVPTVVVLHTVLSAPAPRQRAIVEGLGRRAAALVVQSRSARERLIAHHDLARGRVHVIPHGATRNLGAAGPGAFHRPPVALTWGLLGPGKGIEHAIAALGELDDLDPRPRYIVRGRTHPHVVEREGEAYRESLAALAADLSVADRVRFDDRYLATDEVLAGVRDADVVVLPYSSRDQVVSGVLVEAIASGRPVIATPFPHAVELLSGGAGLLVPHDDPHALAAALRTLLTDPDRAERARAAAKRLAPPLFWENVGLRYRRLLASVAGRVAAS